MNLDCIVCGVEFRPSECFRESGYLLIPTHKPVVNKERNQIDSRYGWCKGSMVRSERPVQQYGIE